MSAIDTEAVINLASKVIQERKRKGKISDRTGDLRWACTREPDEVEKLLMEMIYEVLCGLETYADVSYKMNYSPNYVDYISTISVGEHLLKYGGLIKSVLSSKKGTTNE